MSSRVLDQRLFRLSNRKTGELRSHSTSEDTRDNNFQLDHDIYHSRVSDGFPCSRRAGGYSDGRLGFKKILPEIAAQDFMMIDRTRRIMALRLNFRAKE